MLETIVRPLLSWYDTNARILPWRERPEPYRVWISEIMLQQTRVEAVKPYFDRFLSALPDVSDLASVSEEKLLKLWEGLGYYNRARNLQKAAVMVMEHYNGKLPKRYEELLTLPGIGEYTAGAIASIAFGQPVPAVDGNVLRVITRVLASFDNISLPETKADIRRRLLEIMPEDRPGDFNQALMELGATVCLPNGTPMCLICPLRDICSAYRDALIEEIPVKNSKKERKIEQRTLFIIYYGKEFFLQKRENRGLLANLWEFPNYLGRLTLKQIREEVQSMGIKPARIQKCGTAKHIFTHVEWHMQGYLIEAENRGNGIGKWAAPEDIRKSFALPSAFQAFSKKLDKIIR